MIATDYRQLYFEYIVHNKQVPRYTNKLTGIHPYTTRSAAVPDTLSY